MKKRGILTVLLAGALILTLFSTVQVRAAECESFSIGIGPGITPDYQGSDSYKYVPFPYLNARWSNNMFIQWTGANAKANLVPHNIWRFGPALEFIPERDSDWVDNDRVGKLEDVDHALMAGGFLGIEVGDWFLNFETMADVIDGNDGVLFRLNTIYNVPLHERFKMSVGAFGTYADDDYMQAYFQVSEEESDRTGLKAFEADSGVMDVGCSLSMFYRPWDRVGFLFAGKYIRLLEDAEDSPVTDDEGDPDQFQGGILLVYTFP